MNNEATTGGTTMGGYIIRKRNRKTGRWTTEEFDSREAMNVRAREVARDDAVDRMAFEEPQV